MREKQRLVGGECRGERAIDRRGVVVDAISGGAVAAHVDPRIDRAGSARGWSPAAPVAASAEAESNSVQSAAMIRKMPAMRCPLNFGQKPLPREQPKRVLIDCLP